MCEPNRTRPQNDQPNSEGGLLNLGTIQGDDAANKNKKNGALATPYSSWWAPGSRPNVSRPQRHSWVTDWPWPRAGISIAILLGHETTLVFFSFPTIVSGRFFAALLVLIGGYEASGLYVKFSVFIFCL